MERIRLKEAEAKICRLNIILMGLPGTGKSTLVNSIVPKPNYISLGEITRAELRTDSDLAKQIRSQFDHSRPWSPEFVVSIVTPHIFRVKDTGFILDGLPRQKTEAEKLISWAKENGVRIDLALYLDVKENIGLQRISLRSNEGRLEMPEHYRTRVLTYQEQRNQFAAVVDSYARKSFTIDTSNISAEEVKLGLLEFVASNF